MNNIIQYLTLALFIYATYCIISNIFKYYNRLLYIKNHKRITDILHTYLDMSYKSIYQKDIFIYHSSNNKLTDSESETFYRNYVKLSFDLIGKNMLDVFISLYGDKTTLINNMHIFFYEKLIDDEIIKYMENNKGAM